MEEMRRENEEVEIDLLEIAHLLWRKAWAILLCLIIGLSLIHIYTIFMTRFLVTIVPFIIISKYIGKSKIVNYKGEVYGYQGDFAKKSIYVPNGKNL